MFNYIACLSGVDELSVQVMMQFVGAEVEGLEDKIESFHAYQNERVECLSGSSFAK